MSSEYFKNTQVPQVLMQVPNVLELGNYPKYLRASEAIVQRGCAEKSDFKQIRQKILRKVLRRIKLSFFRCPLQLSTTR